MASSIFTFILLLCCSAFFSASETALFSLSAVQLHGMKLKRSASGLKLLAVLREPRKMLITILLGNELANVSISIVGASIISRLIPAGVEMQTLAAVAIITPIILVSGEILPKNISLRFAPKLAPVLVWPLYLFYRIFRPIRVFLKWIADRVIKILGGEPDRSEPMIMEDEFRRLIDLGRKEGVIAREERELIHNVFEFTDKVVSDIMTPAEQVFSLPIDIPFERVLGEIKSVQFSRVPFHDGGMDNIAGIMHVRDLFSFHRRIQSGEKLDLCDMLHPPLFITESTPLEALLKEFQRTQLHMAIVRDSQEKFRGLVTMDDVLEELFGEME